MSVLKETPKWANSFWLHCYTAPADTEWKTINDELEGMFKITDYWRWRGFRMENEWIISAWKQMGSIDAIMKMGTRISMGEHFPFGEKWILYDAKEMCESPHQFATSIPLAL